MLSAVIFYRNTGDVRGSFPDMRTKRRWQFHVCLCDLSAHFWASGNGDGTLPLGRATQSKSLVYVSEASGKRKCKIPGDCVSDWKYCTENNEFYSVAAAGLFIYFVKFLTGPEIRSWYLKK